MEKKLVAVYGSLRKFGHNHNNYLGEAEYVGEFWSKPLYSLYSLGSYPGLKEDGLTSVLMEVYKVTEEESQSIDYLEGYTEGGRNSFYDKTVVETPFGEASVYIYQPEVLARELVKSGDWKEYFETKRERSRY